MNKKNLLIFMPSVEGGVEKIFFNCQLSKREIFNISLITSDKSIKRKINNNIKLIGPNSRIWQTKS